MFPSISRHIRTQSTCTAVCWGKLALRSTFMMSFVLCSRLDLIGRSFYGCLSLHNKHISETHIKSAHIDFSVRSSSLLPLETLHLSVKKYMTALWAPLHKHVIFQLFILVMFRPLKSYIDCAAVYQQEPVGFAVPKATAKLRFPWFAGPGSTDNTSPSAPVYHLWVCLTHCI